MKNGPKPLMPDITRKDTCQDNRTDKNFPSENSVAQETKARADKWVPPSGRLLYSEGDPGVKT